MTRIKDFTQYENDYKLAKNSPEQFWKSIADTYFWQKSFTKVKSGELSKQNIKWFEDGVCNITENCLDRHLDNRGNKKALIFEPNNPTHDVQSFSYKELHEKVCAFANALKHSGVKKGDRVVFYMGMVPELLIGVLATARIGAVHSVVFGGFSAKSLAQRINDCSATTLITNDGSFRGDKIIPLKDIADEALKDTHTIKNVIVHQRTNSNINMQDSRDIWLHDLLNNGDKICHAEAMNAEDPLFILYTSGSTGQPKGLQHSTAGYMIYAGYTFQNVFQTDEDDIFWCSADIGWITGHSYITYGPLLNGATTVMFEGVPTSPTPSRFWEIIEKHNITHFYTAPTAIRALEARGLEYIQKHSMPTLKVLGSVGEPINEEAWQWFHKHVGKEKCPIVDTWWQTETGGIMISPLAGITETIPTFATRPLPGIQPILVDSDGNEITEMEAQGNLCIKEPWPGIARTIYGDHERYKQTYFSTFQGKYFTGDGAKRDKLGNYRITGRVDDVINVSGHRIGTAEVENAINEHSAVVESAVIGYPHDIKGQGIYAFIISTPNANSDTQDLHKEINTLITDIIGPIAKPDKIKIVSGLPKTRSGKIMRRVLRKVAENKLDELGDTSTLLNPEIIEELTK